MKKMHFSLFSSQMTEGKTQERENAQINPAVSFPGTPWLLLMENPIIFSYKIASAPVKNKINFGALITRLVLKLLWKGNKLLL